MKLDRVFLSHGGSLLLLIATVNWEIDVNLLKERLATVMIIYLVLKRWMMAEAKIGRVHWKPTTCCRLIQFILTRKRASEIYASSCIRKLPIRSDNRGYPHLSHLTAITHTVPLSDSLVITMVHIHFASLVLLSIQALRAVAQDVNPPKGHLSTSD